jgi:hypothetical protein
MSGPFESQWAQGDGEELIKLVETSRTLCPVHFASSIPTYYNRVVKEKWTSAAALLPGHHRSLDTDVAQRVRGTAGGDRLLASCSQHVASLPTVNILFNSIVSSSAFFGTIDLTDFCLNAPLTSSQFLKIHIDTYPPAVLSRLALLPFIKAIDPEKDIFFSGSTRPCTVLRRRVN